MNIIRYISIISVFCGTIQVVFSEEWDTPERAAKLKESWEMAGIAFPEINDSKSDFKKAMDQIIAYAKEHEPDLFKNPFHPLIIARIVYDNKTPDGESEAGTAVNPAPAIAPAANPTEKNPWDPPDWNETFNNAWLRATRKYPDSGVVGAFRARMFELDAWAKTERPDLFANPEKPMIYAQMVREEIDSAKAHASTPQVQTPTWKMYSTNKRFQEEHFDEINEERREHGLEPLPDHRLEKKVDELQEKLDKIERDKRRLQLRK